MMTTTHICKFVQKDVVPLVDWYASQYCFSFICGRSFSVPLPDSNQKWNKTFIHFPNRTLLSILEGNPQK